MMIGSQVRQCMPVFNSATSTSPSPRFLYLSDSNFSKQFFFYLIPLLLQNSQSHHTFALACSMYITHGTHAFMTFWQRSVLVLNTRVTSASHSRASRACFQTNWGSQIWFPLTAAWWCCCCISYVPAIHTVTVRLIKSSVTDGEIDDATGMSIITRYTWTVLKHLKLELECHKIRFFQPPIRGA